MALDSYDEVKAWVLRRADELTDGTSDFDDDVETALIEAWRDLYIRHPWLCLAQSPPAAILLEAPITTLTLTVAAAGAGVAGTLSAIYASSLANYVFVPDGKPYSFRFLTHTAATAIVTIDAAPEVLAAQTGKIVKLDYSLPADFGIFRDGLWGQESAFIAVRSEEEMRGLYPDPPTQGIPEMCARVTKGKIRMSHYSDQARRFEIPYNYEPSQPSGATALVIDPHLRPIFADLGVFYLFEQKSDDKRMKFIQDIAEVKIERAITYEARLAMTLGRRSRETVTGPYGHARTRRRW